MVLRWWQHPQEGVGRVVRLGGEMAAGLDKVYHDRQHGRAQTGNWDRLLGSFPNWNPHRVVDWGGGSSRGQVFTCIYVTVRKVNSCCSQEPLEPRTFIPVGGLQRWHRFDFLHFPSQLQNFDWNLLQFSHLTSANFRERWEEFLREKKHSEFSPIGLCSCSRQVSHLEMCWTHFKIPQFAE